MHDFFEKSPGWKGGEGGGGEWMGRERENKRARIVRANNGNRERFLSMVTFLYALLSI